MNIVYGGQFERFHISPDLVMLFVFTIYNAFTTTAVCEPSPMVERVGLIWTLTSSTMGIYR